MKKLIAGLLLLTTTAYGAQVTHNDYVSGAVITAAGQNSNENAIITQINGNLDNSNIVAAAGIAVNKLAAVAANSVVTSDGSGFLVGGGTSTISGLTVGGSLTVQSSTTLNNTVIIQGTTSGNNAPTGYVGEYIFATQGATNFPATATWGDLVSITLTAGDWDISIVCTEHLATATNASAAFGISTTAGNNGAGLTQGDNRIDLGNITTSSDLSGAIPNFRANITSTTIYYLKFLASYPNGQPMAFGRMSARRIR